MIDRGNFASFTIKHLKIQIENTETRLKNIKRYSHYINEFRPVIDNYKRVFRFKIILKNCKIHAEAIIIKKIDSKAKKK